MLLTQSMLSAQRGAEKKQFEKPEFWTSEKGNRIRDPLPYLDESNPETQVRIPLKAKVVRNYFTVGDDLRGELLRLERIKDYVLLNVRIFDTRSAGRITVGGPRFSHKGVTLFYGAKRAMGDYFLYEEIRAFRNPERDFYPQVVIRFTAPDQGTIYLDPLGTGIPQATVNFSSAPARK
jgi:5-hydroxyisourate hydrolase-like protein (transthyretin family)